MTIRELLKKILQKSREMEMLASKNKDYAEALKKQGAIETTEFIFHELYKSRLFDVEI